MPENKSLSKSVLWLMTTGAGLTVANIYYNQPLLGMIAREFAETEETISHIATTTQIGYAAGLILIIPLGDMVRRKLFILADFVFMILALLSFAVSQSVNNLLMASFVIGLTSVIPQLFVPLTAQLSSPGEKAKNIGQVMAGLLIGILISRVFSGLIGRYSGWREVYIIAAIFIAAFGIATAYLLPNVQSTFHGTYKQLMTSILYYAKAIPRLRLTSFRSALVFGSFSAFWTTIAFHMEKAPFYQGSDIAGLLGLVGICGALSASMTGYITNKINKNTIITATCLTIIASWCILGLFGFTYTGIIAGVVLLDLGMQSLQVTSQTIVFSSHPEASNRINTVYMGSYFIGGSIGSFIGGKAWGLFEWNGVVITGIIFTCISLIAHLAFANRKKYSLVSN